MWPTSPLLSKSTATADGTLKCKATETSVFFSFAKSPILKEIKCISCLCYRCSPAILFQMNPQRWLSSNPSKRESAKRICENVINPFLVWLTFLMMLQKSVPLSKSGKAVAGKTPVTSKNTTVYPRNGSFMLTWAARHINEKPSVSKWLVQMIRVYNQIFSGTIGAFGYSSRDRIIKS